MSEKVKKSDSCGLNDEVLNIVHKLPSNEFRSKRILPIAFDS